ncbi:MAG: hypothetical protein D8M59_11615 [Planctomycetes bacterium]|nr:hypothetical protein [Planctomycetota bacterium]
MLYYDGMMTHTKNTFITAAALPLVLMPVATAHGSALPQVTQQHQQPVTRVDDEADRLIKELITESEESDLGYVEAYKAFKPKFEQFAADHRGTEAEVRALLWLIQQTWWLRAEGTMSEAAMALTEDLLERHPKSKQLDLLVEFQYVFTKEQRAALFGSLLKDSPHAHVKAAAHFGLAKSGPAKNEDGEPNEHYQALLGPYANVKWRESTYGAIANSYLNPHPAEALAVGAVAPEIEGTNHEGKPMKLSDYRGTVIMLDFWGNW